VVEGVCETIFSSGIASWVAIVTDRDRACISALESCCREEVEVLSDMPDMRACQPRFLNF
jgi:hypothetical protein